jgi:shikimate dehydrogenase
MRRFGLIGYPLSHSFSQKYFTEKFQREGITDCVYENYPFSEIEELSMILREYTDLEGLNVTIPYKEKVIPFLSQQNEVVRAIGACNCIRIEQGRLSGYNTDVTGFEQSLLPGLSAQHKKALVLGTGGAAKAVNFVLNKLGIDYLEVSRNAKGTQKIAYQQVTPELLKEHLLIINTTPLGMYPKTDEYPALPYEALTSHHYLFDLVYNPDQTLFLQKGKQQGATIKNGSDMLIIQAEESWRIWNGG